MVCHECGKTVERGQRFCTKCGASLAGVTDTTQVVEAAVASDDGLADHWDDTDPVWAATAEIPPVSTSLLPVTEPVTAVHAGSPSTSELPATEPVTEVQPATQVQMASAAEVAVAEPAAEPSAPYDFAADEPATTTVPAHTAPVPLVIVPPPPDHHFRFSAVTPIAIVAAVVTLIAVFANVVSVTSDTRIVPGDDAPFAFSTGNWLLDDLADNLSIAGLIAAGSMVAGGVAASFRWRWGSGLAAGGGLAFAGIAAIGIGLAQIPIDAAHEFAQIPSDPQITLTITRDLGYWLLIAAGALGAVLFFVSLSDAIGDRRPGLNPWVAALGGLATVVAAAGPLIPENLAVWSDNWYVSEAPGEPPAMLLAARFVQLGLLLFAGVVGFLMVRRYGIGLAIGGSLPIVWLGVSVLLDLTDNPVGPALRNPGATDMHLHAVTIIGLCALVALAVLAVVAAYDQSVRERP